MRKKQFWKNGMISICIAGMLVSAIPLNCLADEPSQESAEESLTDETEVIEITCVEDFLAFAEECDYDSWSVGKTVRLNCDLDLSAAEFDGVAYFSGVFDGAGHTITGVRLEKKGSDIGFFRYIGAGAVVKDLEISGVVNATGSQENIGGIVGVNYGSVEHCAFYGSVSGEDSVGGIAGYNKEGAQIVNSSSNALVIATNYTGGIAGTNEGIISGCVSNSSINVDELQTTLDLGAVDIGTLNLAQNVVTRNDMGGIAGSSSGTIMECINYGTVGFNHTGYNVGGIAGSQSGTLIQCTNYGTIYGRKDVGGIVGQAEPYIESEYLEDKVQETRDDISRLNRTISGISTTLSNTSNQTKAYADHLSQQYSASMDSVAANLDELSAAVAEEHPEAQGYADNINQALDNINKIQSSDEELSQEQLDAIQENLNIINNNLSSLQGTFSGTGESAEDLLNNISGQLQENTAAADIQGMAETIDQGVQSISNSINSAVQQMENIADSVSADISLITGEEDAIVDISSIETAENTDGVISGCVNRGSVTGDLNVGGIAGTMNIEYDGDPEFDLDLTGSVNVVLRSSVNDVIIHSVNYGSVSAKKNAVGGIIGLQEIGFLYQCEGYGDVSAESGKYVGGIAGRSEGTIQSSYSLCNVEGVDYTGGICGSGASLVDCITVSTVDGSGEYSGSIAGMLAEDGSSQGNYFVSDVLGGVDDISYAGIADAISYEELMEMEGMPEGMAVVVVTFETEDEVLLQRKLAYGGSIAESEFPAVPQKDGYYTRWENVSVAQDIRQNLTIRAEYVPWTESVAAAEETEDGKPKLLAKGEFYDDTVFLAEQIDGPDTDYTVQYAYRWELESEIEKAYDSIELHCYLPEEAEEVEFWYLDGNEWKTAESREDGSYLVAVIPYAADFAIVSIPRDNMQYYIGAAAAGIVLLLLIVLLRHRRKKKKAGKK